jgi:hypothetical protein
VAAEARAAAEATSATTTQGETVDQAPGAQGREKQASKRRAKKDLAEAAGSDVCIFLRKLKGPHHDRHLRRPLDELRRRRSEIKREIAERDADRPIDR